MRMLYMSVVASAFLCAVVCWGSRHQQTGLEPDCLMAMSERRMLSKLHVIRDSLLLHDVLVRHRTMFSFIPPRCTTEHHKKSFLPGAIKVYNSFLSVRQSESIKQLIYNLASMLPTLVLYSNSMVLHMLYYYICNIHTFNFTYFLMFRYREQKRNIV